MTNGSLGTQRYGIAGEKLRLRPHETEELSHYSAGTTDVEFFFPWGWGELEGIANRTDFDLRAHQESSGTSLEYFDQATNESYLPHVIEPAAGATRAMMAFLLAAYDEDEIGGERTSGAAPSPAAGPLPSRRAAPLEEGHSQPLVRKRSCTGFSATSCANSTRPSRSAGATGVRTRSARPYCVTIDFESLEDRQVTVRDRDSTDQTRGPDRRPRFRDLLGRFDT